MDWLNAIGWLSRLTSGSVAGVPMTLALMAPVVALLLVTRMRDSAGDGAARRNRYRGWATRLDRT